MTGLEEGGGGVAGGATLLSDRGDMSRQSAGETVRAYTGRFCERPFDACRGMGGGERMRGPLRVPSVPCASLASFLKNLPCKDGQRPLHTGS